MTVEYSPIRTEDRLSYQLARTEHVVRLAIERMLRQEGLSLIAWAILSWLCREPGLSVTELSRRVFVSQQAISKLVAALVREGLLERRPRVGKMRIQDLVPTDKGFQVSAACDEHVIQIEQRLRDRLTPNEIDALGATLENVRSAFSAHD